MVTASSRWATVFQNTMSIDPFAGCAEIRCARGLTDAWPVSEAGGVVRLIDLAASKPVCRSRWWSGLVPSSVWETRFAVLGAD
jgi:hypothetical protein